MAEAIPVLCKAGGTYQGKRYLSGLWVIRGKIPPGWVVMPFREFNQRYMTR